MLPCFRIERLACWLAVAWTAVPAWGQAPEGFVSLFNGRDLSGWKVPEGDNGHWKVVDGVIDYDNKSEAKGEKHLWTEKSFVDFTLRLEWRFPDKPVPTDYPVFDADGNEVKGPDGKLKTERMMEAGDSGVYLRGRYELQIDDSAGLDPSSHHLGGVYGFIAPSENAARPAGEWQSMEVTFVGRMLTYDLNGKTIICNREIPGITGGALDSSEAEPGPLLLQGDHGPVDYRNIVITPAKVAR